MDEGDGADEVLPVFVELAEEFTFFYYLLAIALLAFAIRIANVLHFDRVHKPIHLLLVDERLL